ncbi:MAG: TolC family outer membrane protein, partial [Gammaproteobacteria bacterium]|nr:TolC family outer membrane protein [Gammaproteobacteria bacterium]
MSVVKKLFARTLPGPRIACLAMVFAWGSAGAVDLVQVYELALTSDPVYQREGATNRATQELAPQARARLLPNMNLTHTTNGNVLDVKEANSIAVGSGTRRFNSNQWALNVTQPLYRRDLWIQLDQADGRIKQANAAYSFALQDLMLRTAERYFDVLRAADELRFARAEMEAFEQQLKQSQQRFEVGLIAITDVEEAQAGFDLARAQVIAAENQQDVALEALREITGEYHPSLDGLGPNLTLVTPEPDNIDTWTEIALKQNLQLTAALYAAEVARDEIRRVESGHLPTVDLVGSHTRNASNGGFSGGSESEQTSLGLQLTVPIYQGGFTVSRTRETRHLYQQSIDEVERIRRATHRQTRDAYLGVMSGISRVKALEQAVKSTES